MATIKAAMTEVTALLARNAVAAGNSEVTAALVRAAVAAGNSQLTAPLARIAVAARNSEVIPLFARIAVAARNSEVIASLARTAVAAGNSEVTASLARIAVAARNSEVTASLASTTVAAGGVVSIVGWIAIAFGLATVAGGVAYVVYRTAKGYHKLIDSTDAVLDLAITEVLQWQYSTAHEDNNTERVSKEKRLQLLGKYENLTRSSKCCVLQRCLGGGISMLV